MPTSFMCRPSSSSFSATAPFSSSQHELLAFEQQQQQQQQQQEQNCCYLSAQETADQVPDSDIARVTFYLRCCILGCGLQQFVQPQHMIATELLDFAQAQFLPLELQNYILRLAFEDFGLCNLLDKFLYVDTNQQVLPPGVSTMFVPVTNTTNYIYALSRLSMSSLPDLPLGFNGNILICSSEWIQQYHILPFQRYFLQQQQQQQSLPQEPQHHHQQQQQQHQQESSAKKVEATVQYDYGDDDESSAADIPMVTAVPLDQPSYSQASSDMDTSDHYDIISGSLIVPGQQVRLYGLETEEMNDAIGIVHERKDNRVIVKIANHPCKYSVRLENLIIVQEAVAAVYDDEQEQF